MAPLHKRAGTFDAFYILADQGEVNDNGVMSGVRVGDVMFTDDGESHSIKNIRDSDLEYIALIISTK